jgi:hypothetical protein
VYCSDSSCEDFKSKCVCPDCKDNHYFRIKNLSPEYDGTYRFDFQNKFLQGNQTVFETNGNCVWWHQQYRHWWVGSCDNIGINAGYAYAEEDVDCPVSAKVWRIGGSDECIQNVELFLNAKAGTGGEKSKQSFGTGNFESRVCPESHPFDFNNGMV